MLALVAVALALIGVASVAALDGYLVGRARRPAPAGGPAARPTSARRPGPGPRRWAAQPPTWSSTGLADGQLDGAEYKDLLEESDQSPRVPDEAAWLDANSGQGADRAPPPGATAAGGSPCSHWRDGSGGSVVVAASLDGIDSTTRQLRLIDLVVGVVVLVVLAAVGAAIVRTSLRPLVEIEHTAAAIAAGDLTRRVPDRDPRTEVGRLGRALNTMLAQIEAAFAGASRRARPRRRPGAPRSGCASSSPTPPTSCAPR